MPLTTCINHFILILLLILKKNIADIEKEYKTIFVTLVRNYKKYSTLNVYVLGYCIGSSYQ